MSEDRVTTGYRATFPYIRSATGFSPLESSHEFVGGFSEMRCSEGRGLFVRDGEDWILIGRVEGSGVGGHETDVLCHVLAARYTAMRKIRDLLCREPYDGFEDDLVEIVREAGLHVDRPGWRS